MEKCRGRPPKPVNPIVQANQDKFDKALEHWISHKDKKSWDEMFMSIHFACSNIIKKMLKNIYDPECEELALDSACYCMERIRDHDARPEKLSAWCWTRCMAYVYKQERVWRGKNISLLSDFSLETEQKIKNKETEIWQ